MSLAYKSSDQCIYMQNDFAIRRKKKAIFHNEN